VKTQQMKPIVQPIVKKLIIMTTKTLFKGTERELLITDRNGVITVETKEDLRLKELRKQEFKFFYENGILLLLSFLLGCCITYLIMI